MTAIVPVAFPETEWPPHLVPLQPAAAAQSDALAALAQMKALTAALVADPYLTPAGQVARLTDAVAAPLAKLATHAERLDRLATTVAAEAEKLVQDTTPPVADVEKLERRGEALGRLAPDRRLTVLEEAFTGKDRAALEAFATCPAWLTGIGESQRQRAARFLRAAAEQAVPTDKAAALRERAAIVGQVKATVVAARGALEDAADRQALKERGVPVAVRRGDMTEEAKVAFIGNNGVAAFKALPS